MSNQNFKHTQEEEARTWLLENAVERNDKAQRETIRYPLIKKQMGLNHLDTSKMVVFDIGAGALGGVSTIVNCKRAIKLEPLAKEYNKYYSTYGYEDVQAENLKKRLGEADLIIVTNALDHFEDPASFLQDLAQYMKSGAYFAHLHAINNAITHPHEAHAHNVNPEMFRDYLTDDFECVWYQDFQQDGLTYGWRKQPAFSGLYRKVTGYGK